MNGPRASILMVDDRPENLVALEAILEPLGHRLVRAHSGEEALRHVLREDFAVVLMDVQMPGMNGFETVQIIKSRERSKHLPIIFLTAISKDEQYVFEGYSAGAVDYLSKPFNPAILRSKVAVFVDLFLKNEQIREQSEQLRESERRTLELQHQARIQESDARFAEIVDSAMEAIITFGDDRRVTVFNGTAEQIFGCPRDEAIGRPVDDFFVPPLDSRVIERLLKSHAEGGGIRRQEMTGRHSSGAEFPVEMSVSCLELDSENVYTVIVRDITARRQAEEALRMQAESLAARGEELRSLNEELSRRQEALEEAMSARSRFYASMSHELRTPINAILGYTSLMLEDVYGTMTDQQVFGLERAKKAAQHLLELVNDVLDLSKIEAGKMELLVEPVAFPDVVNELFITVGPLAEKSGTPLNVNAAGEPFTVETDPRRIRQILLNLLSNALKFGDGKPVTVHCRQRADGGVEVDVEDRGEGIPADETHAIFDEFVQLHGTQGTGLGLPISRRLAQLLGGTLEIVRTQVGEGSTFRLSLPPLQHATLENATAAVALREFQHTA
ncbi:MAG TPA: ATP-binding protein [Longimicrobiales bacterium]|nr:ATP-binding protein [Longimicrobiales bacterium]